mmetsp:Transcript_84659/g.218207  ORF Transcript_84659/g.218207 Transcript_84659/m.218207 type:complete len:237 (+) Transcript_84659:441-1151(+)
MEVLEQLCEDEVQRPQAEHRKRRGGEVDEGAVVLRDLRGHRVHREDQVNNLQHEHDQQQHRSLPYQRPAAGGRVARRRRLLGRGLLRVHGSPARIRCADHGGHGSCLFLGHAHEQQSMAVVRARQGQPPRHQLHALVLARVLVVVIGGCRLVAAPDEDEAKSHLHDERCPKEFCADNVEEQAEHNRAEDPQEQALVQVLGRGRVRGEHDMEEEYVIHGEKILQEIAVEPDDRHILP